MLEAFKFPNGKKVTFRPAWKSCVTLLWRRAFLVPNVLADLFGASLSVSRREDPEEAEEEFLELSFS